ncbi:TPA: hypothetical protein U1C39_000932 [Streptococcus suis]|nr:hypothetical protein [Streptococcus suis]
MLIVVFSELRILRSYQIKRFSYYRYRELNGRQKMMSRYRAFYEGEMYGVKAVIWTSRGLYVTLDDDNKAGRRVRGAKLMQSTGLFDSSETPKEIFDGDIIRLEVPNQSMCGTYEVRRANSGEWRIDSRTQGRRLYDSLNNITVIGNSYENPELVEEVK